MQTARRVLAITLVLIVSALTVSAIADDSKFQLPDDMGQEFVESSTHPDWIGVWKGTLTTKMNSTFSRDVKVVVLSVSEEGSASFYYWFDRISNNNPGGWRKFSNGKIVDTHIEVEYKKANGSIVSIKVYLEDKYPRLEWKNGLWEYEARLTKEPRPPALVSQR